MGLRLTIDEGVLGLEESNLVKSEELKVENQKVFLYGFFTGNEASLSSNPLIAYALTEGYDIENRDINELGSHLKEAPEAVVINPASVSFSQLLLGLAIITPKHPKVLFLFSLSNSSENLRAFWRNFGVLTILSFPISPIELFSLIKIFRKLVGKVEPEVDFTLNVDFPVRTARPNSFVDFVLTVTNTSSSNFNVVLNFTGSEVGNQINFFPEENKVPFTSTCRVFVPASLSGKTAVFFVEARGGKVLKVLKLTLIVT